MRRLFFPSLVLSCLLLGVAVLPAKALMVAPPPLPMRVAGADLVIVGKVTGFGPKLVPGELFKGDTRMMQVATIQVSETLLGKGVKQVQVGFFPPANTPPPKGGIRPPIRRYPTVQFTVGQEACVLLTRHPSKPGIYVAQNYYDVLSKTGNPGFATQADEIRKAAKLLANPTAGLRSKDADERLTTAGLLITKYRTPKAGAKQEPISAEQSKLILETLVNADWDVRRPGPNAQMNPQSLFLRLGLTPKDGWNRPRDFRQMNVEAKKWLQANAGKFRLQRYVVAEPKEVPTPEPK